MLLDNAAKKLGVPVEELTTGPSVVIHEKSKRRLTYGQIAAFAEVPDKAPEIKPDQLKKPADFRLIGKDVMRVELPGKVDGRAKYSIDLQLPGMLYGVVLREPIEGAGVDKIDEAQDRQAARRRQGREPAVRRRRARDDGLGCVGRAQGARRRGDLGQEGRRQGFDSEKGLDQFAADARNLATKVSEWTQGRRLRRRRSPRPPRRWRPSSATTSPITRRWSR